VDRAHGRERAVVDVALPVVAPRDDALTDPELAATDLDGVGGHHTGVDQHRSRPLVKQFAGLVV
jgi:hypothetical protein